MTPAIVDGISERYIELYEHITGEKFEKAIRTISFPVSKRT